MTPEIGLLIGQALLKYGPEIATAIAGIFQKKTHTIEDWNAIFAKVKTYAELDAESKARAGTAP